MIRSRRSVSFVWNFVILCMLSACTEPPPDDMEPEFTFAGKISIDPLKKLYSPGDTIWLKYSNPGKALIDIHTGQVINSDSLALQFSMSFNPIYAPGASGQTCRYFSPGANNHGIIKGQFGTGFYGSFGCKPPGNSDFRIGVIPEKEGIYGLFLSEALQVVEPCRSRSDPFHHSVISYKFDVADGNKDIFLSIPPGQLPDEEPKGTLSRWIDEKRVVVIKVE